MSLLLCVQVHQHVRAWVCHCVLCTAVIIFNSTKIQLLSFPRHKVSNSVFLDVCFCVCRKMCKDSSVCVSQETTTSPNCNSVPLAAVTIGYNLSEPSFSLVYVDIKPHTHFGKLKHTLSDSTTIHNHLDTLTKDLTMAHLLCLLFV